MGCCLQDALRCTTVSLTRRTSFLISFMKCTADWGKSRDYFHSGAEVWIQDTQGNDVQYCGMDDPTCSNSQGLFASLLAYNVKHNFVDHVTYFQDLPAVPFQHIGDVCTNTW